MIGQLTGKIIPSSPQAVIIDVGGIGYEVFISQTTHKTLTAGENHTLLTYLAVRENALELYGFSTLREKDLFTKLINVPGIGPKSAIAILSLATLDTLIQAISKGDAAYLTTVSGIGKKSAEKIIVELRDKMETMDQSETNPEFSDVFDALVALGYAPRNIREIITSLPKEATTTNEQIKEALKLLSKK